jgi:hypothetical protein
VLCECGGDEEVLMYTILYLNGLMTLNVVPLVSLFNVMFTTCICEFRLRDTTFEFQSELEVYIRLPFFIGYTDLLVHSAGHLGKLYLYCSFTS